MNRGSLGVEETAESPLSVAQREDDLDEIRPALPRPEAESLVIQ